jgi:hypothetical protein
MCREADRQHKHSISSLTHIRHSPPSCGTHALCTDAGAGIAFECSDLGVDQHQHFLALIMHDMHEPLNLAEDSVRGAERLLVDGQPGTECSFRAEGPGGAAGTASVQADGSFSFKTQQAMKSGCRKCLNVADGRRGPAVVDIEVIPTVLQGRRSQRDCWTCFGKSTGDIDVSSAQRLQGVGRLLDSRSW